VQSLTTRLFRNFKTEKDLLTPKGLIGQTVLLEEALLELLKMDAFNDTGITGIDLSLK